MENRGGHASKRQAPRRSRIHPHDLDHRVHRLPAHHKDYKEMGAALIALAFALLHFSRTFMGLWQLHVFKQWAISSIKSMESLGYETRLQAVAAPCVDDVDTDEEEDDVGSESGSATSSEETDSNEEEGNVGTESERGTAEERKRGEKSGKENVHGAQGDIGNNTGRSNGGSGAQQRGCWFPWLLKELPFSASKGAEREKIEGIADDILVNDTLIDNRLSDVHTVCNFRFLSKAEEKMVRRVRLPSKDKVKTVKGALKGALLTLKRLCLRIRYGFPRALCVFRVLYSLVFHNSPHVSNLNSGPRLVPRHPESVWLNWAAALVAQAGWVLEDSVLVDPDPSAGYAENRNRFAGQVLLSVALHTRNMTAAKRSTSGRNKDGDRISGFLSFRDWHEYPELCKGKFSKQEWLKRACKSGNGLPYQVRHRQAKETKDRWGYGNFKSELVLAREALPPELESRVKNFDVERLEWFTIFVSIENWAPWCSGTEKEGDMENKDDIPSDCSKSSSDSRGDVEEDNVELENDIPFENLKKQLGFDNQISCVRGPEQKEGEPENRPENRLGCTTEPNLQEQHGDTKASSFILGSLKLPYMRNLLRANLWGNRNVLEVNCHVDNWIALCASEQTSYMAERVSQMEQDLRDSYASRKIDEIVAASAKFENCRFLCQMAIIRPEHNHFDKSMTFLGCSMEMLRSSLAQWAETNGHSEEGTWKPCLFSNGIVPGTTRSEGLGRWKGSDDFTSCFRSLKSLAAMSRSFVKMRVLWELQNRFQTHLQKNEFTPNSLEAIALCIMSFPAVSVKLRDRREPSAIARFVEGVEERIEVSQRREECIVAVHGGGEKSFGIENYEYVICSSCGPQDLQLILTFEALQEKSNIVLSMLLCEMEGQKVDCFDWEVWRNAFYGRLEACRQWKAEVGISNLALIAPTERINAGIQKESIALDAAIPESGTGTEMSVWKGWPPHCTSICMYELSTENFILQPRQVKGVSVPVSIGEGRTFQTNIPQEIWEPVKYAEANESSLKKASVVAQSLLSRNEDISLAHASDTDVSVALHAAVEQEILQLRSNLGKKEAVF